MKKNIINILIVISLICYTVGTSFSATGDGGLPGYFLDQGVSARLLGMGKVGVATANDSAAVYYNPALLPILDRIYFSSMYHSLFEGTKYFNFDFVPLPFGNWNFGLGVIGLISEGVEGRDNFNNINNQNISGETDIAILISNGYRINEMVSIGLGVKVINKSFANVSAMGIGTDLSVICRPPIINNLVTGINLQNLISPTFARENGNDNTPLNIKLGLGYGILDNRLSGGFDLDLTSGKAPRIHAGAEFLVTEIITVRAGYDSSAINAGLGIGIKGIRLDYAMSYNFNLGLNHRISLVLQSRTKQEIQELKIVRQKELEKEQDAKRLDADNKIKVLKSLIEKAESVSLPTAEHKTVLSNAEKEFNNQNYDNAITIITSAEEIIKQAISEAEKQPSISKTYVRRTFANEARENAIQKLKTETKVNLAIAEFNARPPITKAEADFVSEFLRGELIKAECFNILDRANMNKILEEQKLQTTGLTEAEMAIKIGKLLNVQKIITGSVGKFVNDFVITIDVVDVETAKSIYFDKVTCSEPKDFNTAIEDIVISFIIFTGK